MENKNNKTIKIILGILAVLIVAGLGSVFVNIGMEWFDSLTKPSQWIPDFVIPLVWTVIYLTISVVIFLWIKNQNSIPKEITILLIINGILNLLWCLTFFTLRQLFLGNVVIILNLFFAVYLILKIYNSKKLYGLFLLIYPIWICIATSLNTALWILN